MNDRIGWSIAPTADEASWLSPYAYPAWGPGQVGPFFDGVTHVLRILHPLWNQDEHGITEVTWAQVAAARGVTIEDGDLLQDVSGDNSPDPALDGVFDTAWWVGTLPAKLFRPILEHLPDATHGLVWEGWADVRDSLRDAAIAAGTLVHGQGQLRYIPITLSDTTSTPDITGRTPAFWWPPDRSWLAASGIDEFHTYVISDRRDLLEPIHHDQRFETQLYNQEPRTNTTHHR